MEPETVRQGGTAVLAPPLPKLTGEHDKMAHIVLEGWKPNDDDLPFAPVQESVVGSMINGTPVRALCGKLWTPGDNPRRLPLCGTCRDIAESHGWKVPT